MTAWKHGGRNAGTHELLEGQRPSRVVIVEFPNKQRSMTGTTILAIRPLIAKRRAAL